MHGADCNGMGPAMVTWQGLAAWSVLTGTPLAPWEARVMVRLGSLRAAILSETTTPAKG